MTWEALKATGRGAIVLALEIVGYPYVFTSYEWTPTDSWYTSAYYDAAKPWLNYDAVELGDISRFIEGHFEVDSLTVQVTDLAAGMTALLRDFAARAWTRLASTVAASDTSIVLLDASIFPASGRVWLGQEAVHYTSRTATTLTVDRRGDLGTTARAYAVDYSTEPPAGLVVADGPTDIRGRPCRLHVAEVDQDTGTPGPTTVLYRGFVSPEAVIGRGRWQIPIEHISVVLDRHIGAGLPSVPVRTTYHFSGDPDSISVLKYQTFDSYVVNYEITMEGTYSDPYTMARDFNELASAQASVIDPLLQFGGKKFQLYIPANATVSLQVNVRRGDVLWCLGFDAGIIIQGYNVALTQEADSEPRALMVDCTEGYDVTVLVDSVAGLIPDLYAALPEHAFAKVKERVPGKVIFYAGSQDPVRAEPFWAIEEAKQEDMRLSHVFAYSGDPTDPDSLVDAMKRSLYLLSGQDEPESWCAFGLTADDFDFNELETALSGIPAVLYYFYDAVTEGISFKDIFGPRMGVLGVAPRITEEGRIGFARIETPTELSLLDIELDDDVWSAMEAAEAEARLGGDPLLTQARVKMAYDYRTDKWPDWSTFNWIDGVAERGRVRAIELELRGLAFSDQISFLPDNLILLERVMAGWLTAVLYGLFGRMSADLIIPCTWLAKRFKVGDQVVISHPLAPDLVEGQIGVEGRPGIIIGRRQPITEDRPDELIVKIPPRTRASGIAPCALAESWNPSTLTLTFPDADDPLYAAEGGNDLDEFIALEDVYLWEYDVDPPSGSYPLLAYLTDVNPTAKTATLVSNPFPGGVFPTGGVWMVWPDWGQQTTRQQAWLSIADLAYGLGTTPDPGFVWGI